MLTEMRIEGLGVIDEATLELHPGLTVVTGETGAGKTMVVTGLHLLAGGRADVSRIRRGVGRAVVEGRFMPPQASAQISSVAELASEVGARADEDGSLIASRTLTPDGRSRAHLGGRSVPAGVLAELAESMLAVHGQNDQLRLLRAGEQRVVLDRFAGDGLARTLVAYRRVRERWQQCHAELTDRRDRSRELAREADLLSHGLAEITAIDPQPGEGSALLAEARRLADAEALRETTVIALTAVCGGPEGDPDQPNATGLVGEARRRLQSVEDPLLRALGERLAEAAAVLGDVGAELGGYLESLSADPARLEHVLSRQAELKRLTRKYAGDVDGVLAWADQARQRLASLDTSEEAIAALTARRDELADELAQHARALTAARTAAARELGEAVTAELAGLAMGQAQLSVAVRPAPATGGDQTALTLGEARLRAGPDGVDEVEFLLSPHPSAGSVPVHKGASGGELSRVMLALEVVLAEADPVPTMVFDEVDAGVGGRAAVEIGRRLARLARSHQVVVVTHLPQVAAYADRHLVVDKVTCATGLTRSGVRELDDAARVTELARMLAGLDDTETGRAHAGELLSAAAADKGALVR
ncbi:MAG TPA: DNA repair protein RecN [Pseudonocardiaceae bacterium]|nr:DNA repair protein RecN [Pseudonocardiaceae bacterium]